MVELDPYANSAPMLSRFAQSSFYSTAKPGSTGPNKDDGYVAPAPASMEEISHSHALQAGSMDAVAPESSMSQTTTPPPPPPTGVVGKAKDFLRKGKEIVIQCKDGVKLLWVNKKIVKDLKRAQKENGYQLTRREFQLVSYSCRSLACAFMTRSNLFFARIGSQDRYRRQAHDSFRTCIPAGHRVHPIDHYLCSTVDPYDMCYSFAAGKHPQASTYVVE